MPAKRILIFLAIIASLGLTTACSEGPAEKAGEKVDKMLNKGPAEKAGESVDKAMEKGADKIEEAGDKAKKAVD